MDHNVMPLLSKGNLIVLESLSFTQTLYAFDFDGTLAKIVRVPADAKMSPSTERLLRTLSELVPVAVISGRSVEDLKHRIPFRPRYLIGNHGMEGLGNKHSSLREAQKTCELWKQHLKRAKFEPGILVEDKTYSLAIHYRRSRQKARARAQIDSLVQKLFPAPRILMGKSVVNLIPSGAPHKGAAVLELVRHSGMKHVFYVGDDDTDEDVFDLPYAAGTMMTVRVGKKKNSSAHYYLQRQSQINRVLRILIGHHQPAQQRAQLRNQHA